MRQNGDGDCQKFGDGRCLDLYLHFSSGYLPPLASCSSSGSGSRYGAGRLSRDGARKKAESISDCAQRILNVDFSAGKNFFTRRQMRFSCSTRRFDSSIPTRFLTLNPFLTPCPGQRFGTSLTPADIAHQQRHLYSRFSPMVRLGLCPHFLLIKHKMHHPVSSTLKPLVLQRGLLDNNGSSCHWQMRKGSRTASDRPDIPAGCKSLHWIARSSA